MIKHQAASKIGGLGDGWEPQVRHLDGHGQYRKPLGAGHCGQGTRYGLRTTEYRHGRAR